MKSKILIIFFLGVIKISLGQTKIQDSIITEKINLGKLYNINNELLEKVELLNKEIEILKVKEAFFSSAFSDQATRFSLIAASLLALVGGISFSLFKYELKQLKNNFDKKFDTFEDEQNKFIKIASESIVNNFTTSGNTKRLIADSYKLKKMHLSEFQYLISSAADHKKSFDSYYSLGIDKFKKAENKEKTIDVINDNLIAATTCFIEKIKVDPTKKTKFPQEKLDYIYLDLDTISNIEVDEIKYKAAKIRVELSEFVILK